MNKRPEIQDMYPLSPLQEGILFHSIEDEGNGTYIEKSYFTVNGDLDVDLLEQSFNKVVERYDVLRTVFSYSSSRKPLQIVLKRRNTRVHYEDISALEKVEKDKFIDSFKEQDSVKGFNLLKDILMRISVFKTGDKEYKVIWSFHHIIMDGWCLGIIMQELFQIYYSLKNNEPIMLNSVKPYMSFIKWLGEQDEEEALSYWTKYLEDYDGRVTIPKYTKIDEVDDYIQKELEFKIDEELSEKLKSIAVSNGTTVSVIFQAIWGILLQKYNSIDDVVFGLVVSGRQADITGIQDIVGLFINTIPVRIKCEKGTTFSGLLRQVQESALISGRYGYVQLGEIQKRSRVGQGLVENLFVYENYSVDKMNTGADIIKKLQLDITNMEVLEKTNYDFNILIGPGKELGIKFRYNSLVHSDNFVSNIEGHIKKVIKQITDNADIRINEIEVPTDKEKSEILYNFNDTKAEYEKHKMLHQVFEEQVEKVPDSIAVVFENEQLTYSELNKKANQLARVLRANGVKGDSIVGVMIQRSIEMMVGIMAILKAGGAYLPIDPLYPKERIEYMLSDSGTGILLTNKSLFDECKAEFNGLVMDLYDGSLYTGEETNLININNSRNLAYVIYTSGSTGKPKGTLIEHYSVINRLNWMQKKYPLKEQDIILQKTPYTFDVSVWELFWWSFAGADVCFLQPQGEKDPEIIVNTIQQNKITVMHFVPSMLNAFLEYIEEQDASNKLSSLKQVFASGEALGLHQAKKFNRLLNKKFGTNLANLYGPTEATVDVSYFDCSTGEELESIPIGKPIDNINLYVVGKDTKLQPIGASGELCIAGDGLARGYLNRPELTSEKFIPNPFVQGTKMYRTGDLARWLPDGNIEFLGRLDHQVKIRGNRIEVGEIESVILNYKSVREIAVLAKKDENGNSSLYAFMVTGEEFDVNDLKHFLSTKIPKYMIPSFFYKLEKMPLSPNGKVDRKALMSQAAAVKEETIYVAPQSEEEKKLIEIYCEVLDVSNIGIKDNFINLGGDSIKAIRVFSSINKAFGTAIKIRDIYKYPVIEDLAWYIRSGNKEDESNKIVEAENVINKFKESILEDKSKSKMLPEGIEDFYPMSDIQKGMVYHSSLNSGEAIYHDQFIYQIKDLEFNIEHLSTAASLLVHKHPILRTSFNIRDFSDAIQIVHSKTKLDIQEYDISSKDKYNQENYIKQYLIEDRNNPFNIETYPLWRMRIFNLGNGNICLCWIFHHAIIDGWSNASFMTELVNTYQMLGKNKEFIPDKLSNSYKSFIVEQLAIKRDSKVIEYWKQELDGYKRLEFPAKWEETSNSTNEIRYNSRSFASSLLNKVRETAQQYNTDVRTILFTAYTYMLNMISYENDIVVGLVENSRPDCEDSDKILGCFLNTVPVRIKLDKNMMWENLIIMIREKLMKLKVNGRLPLTEIAKVTGETFSSDNPIFNTLFVYIDFHIINKALVENMASKNSLEIGSYERTNTCFDIVASVTHGELVIKATYLESMFTEEQINCFLDYYMNTLNLIVNEPKELICKEKVMSEYEKNRLLLDFNNTSVEFYTRNTINILFEEQVKKNPHNIAIIFDDKELTYGELNKRANQLARYLRNKGVTKDRIVGIMLKRSLDMVTAIMGVLKAGGAYLPLDPDYPVDRIQYMLEDSGADILLMQTGVGEILEFKGEKINVRNAEIYSGDSSDLEYTVKPDSLAYVIYTSGSTGKPKGVMIEHASIASRLMWRRDEYGIDSNDVMLQLFSYSFDGFVTSFFTAVISGARVIILNDEEEKDPAAIKRHILEQGVTGFISVPPLYSAVLECMNSSEMKTLRAVTLAGDKTPRGVIRQSKDKNNALELFNEYGPTECSVVSTIFRDMQESTNTVIGKPVANTRVYIIDEHNNLQPTGTTGEMCIGGNGLARGYLNMPGMTREKFIDNPFVAGEKIYRTGDLARWLPDGNIEFLGRIDHQVKIRGFRIECGEIETRLAKHKNVKEAVVIAKEDADNSKYLCAYITTKKDLLITELREYLSMELPEYMIPSYFVQLERIPLTPNGKIDRKSLPEPVRSSQSGVEYEAPTNEIEERLVEVWREVLGIEKIGINDNFVEIGGDSIKAMQVSARLLGYGLKIGVKDLILHGRIKELSSLIKISGLEISQDTVYGKVELLPIQRWFFENVYDESSKFSYFNQAVMLYKKDVFDEAILRKVFTRIVEHHDALRMVYKTRKEIVQYNRPLDGELFTLDVFDLRGISEYRTIIEENADKLQRSIDIENGPLVKLGLFKTAYGDHLLIIVHHLVIDGMSWRVILEDLARAYMQAVNGMEVMFPLKTNSYKEWADKLHSYANSREIINERGYWEQLEKYNIASLPKDGMTNRDKYKDSNTLIIDVPYEYTKKLLSSVNHAYNTQINDILLTALGLAVKDWSKNGKVLVNLESNGREELFETINITRTVGWFTSVYPVVLDMEGDIDIGHSIEKVKSLMRAIPNKGIGFGILKYLTAQENKGALKFNLKPEILFNYLGQFDNDIKSEMFEVSDISTGISVNPETNRSYAFEINGMVAGGKLTLQFNYNRKEYRENTVRNLAGIYKEKLLQIIDHCLAIKPGDITVLKPGVTGDWEVNKANNKVQLLDTTYSSILPAEEKEYYTMSSAQKKFYILTNLDEASTAYNATKVIMIEGILDRNRIENAFSELIKRHEILRTSLHIIDGVPVQKVHKNIDFELGYIECKEKDIDDVIKGFIKAFDLSKAPLIRASLMKVDKNKHILMIDMHHTVMDRVSMSILMKEFMILYDGGVLPKLKIQYKDFSEWQHRMLESEYIKRQKEYWNNMFSGTIPVLNMPLDFKRGNMQTFNGNSIKFDIPPIIVEKLERMAKEQKVTLNILLFSIYSLLLNKYSGQTDIVVGSIMSGRSRVELENLIGAFMNFLPIKLTINEEWTFEEFLINTVRLMLEVYDNQDYPFEQIIEDVCYEADPSRNPLFDTMMVFHNELEPNISTKIDGLKFNEYGYDLDSSALDFKLDIFLNSNEGSLNCRLEYNTDLFRAETIESFAVHFSHLIEILMSNKQQKLLDIDVFTKEEKLKVEEKRKLNTIPESTGLKLAVSATFTAEPIENHIKWWCGQFKEDVILEFAPYNQVFRQLLDSESLISKNNGINLLLARFEDFIKDDKSQDEEKCIKLERNFTELVEAIRENKSTVPIFIGVFPISKNKGFSSMLVDKLVELNKRFKEAVKGLGNTYIIDFSELDELYSIENSFDEVKDFIGHIPFSDEYIAAMGATIARHICAWKRPHFKAIVLDCDNTLWNGVCGEEGALGVTVSEAYYKLQEFIIEKHNEGMLLVLCSKNNEDDVWEVFDKNPGMLLKREHIAAYRVNWRNKSENVKDLADELNIGLDSFIFIDDSYIECSEMMANLPEVLTITLPEDETNIPCFLRHVWAFDRLTITDEDRRRTQMYKAEKERQKMKNSNSLKKYLDSLQLKVSIYPMHESQLSRVAQMTQRTNQFNLNTIRRTEVDIKELVCEEGTICWVIEASDRFGEYGIVGTVITIEKGDSLFVETFLLSCRILGREVEDAVLIGLKEYCNEKEINTIEAEYHVTQKNRPVLDFIQKGLWEKVEAMKDGIRLTLKVKKIPDSVKHIELDFSTTYRKEYEKDRVPPETVIEHEKTLYTSPDKVKETHSVYSERVWQVHMVNEKNILHRNYLLALQNHTGKMLLELPVNKISQSKKSEVEYEAPRNEVEERLVKVWKQILGLDRISIHNNFLDLGGDSIKAVFIVSSLLKYNIKVQIKDILSRMPLQQLAQHAELLIDNVHQKIVEGKVKLTAVQECFFERNFTDPQHWTAAVLLYRKEHFDEEIIKKVFTKIVEYHDALRIVFRKENSEIIQYNRGIEGELFSLKLVDLTGNPDYRTKIEEESYKIQDEIDLQHGPLLKLGLFRTSEGDHLLVACHHLVCDGISMLIMLADFNKGYNQVLNNMEIKFEGKTDSYMEWSEKLNIRANSEEFMKEADYWVKMGKNRIAELPKDFKVSDIRRFKHSKSVRGILLNEEEVSQLMNNSNKVNGASVQEVLLTGLGLAIKDWTGEDKILVRLGGHGRDIINDNLNVTRTVGWFGVSYPVILDISNSDDILLQVHKTKEMLQAVPSRGEGYDLMKYITEPEKRSSIQHNLNPEIYFNNKVVLFSNTANKDVYDKADKLLYELSNLPQPIDRSMYTEREYTLNFTLEVEKGGIILDIDFDINEYREETMHKIFENYKRNLKRILTAY